MGKRKATDTAPPRDRVPNTGKQNAKSKLGKTPPRDYSKARCGECGEYGHTTGYHDTYVKRQKECGRAASSTAASRVVQPPTSEPNSDEDESLIVPRSLTQGLLIMLPPEKMCAIAQWPVPVSQKGLRKWFGLANYLHKYNANYANMARPMTNLLKKDAVWSWTSEAQQAFEAIKSSLQSAPILALPGEDRPFSVVCMHPILPLAVPCYRLMPRAVSG
ncbi:unnamed protein product [Phytophthora fragariaefolia]|uniref:Unnamed protein product n=1 Tax=Phytophthora fragariaefolia TaxID=1490495 RepID=A0A9W6XHM8_9STRA|nr:unnamed protein product [Phytophthora fragariaefolia]